MQDFHQLIVWQRAHAFAILIRDFADGFPAGYADLRAQLTRAAESIPSNIVEGCGAATKREFARYLDIAIKSSSEVEYELELARDAGTLGEDDWKRLSGEVVEIRKMLFGLRRAVLAGSAGGRRRAKTSDHPG